MQGSQEMNRSKFIYQDIDEVFLANKCIVIGCFVDRNYDTISMETGKLSANIRVTKFDKNVEVVGFCVLPYQRST